MRAASGGPPTRPSSISLRTTIVAWAHADHAGPSLAWSGASPSSCSCTDLARSLSTFATFLARAGLLDAHTPPARPPTIGLFLEGPGPAWVAAALGCWAAGCAFASLDPAWPPGVAAAALEKLCLDAIVWAAGADGSPPPDGAGRPAWDVGGVPLIELPPGWPSAEASRPQPPPAWWPAPSPPPPFCYALPTSGTTTPTPRFVLGTWGGVVARLEWATEGLKLGPGDTVACLTRPTAVDAVAASLLPLLAGASVVCADPTNRASTATALAGATVLAATPSAWSGLLAARAPLASLRLAVSSGEPLPRTLAAAIASALPPGASFLNVYGLTEAAGDSTAADVRAWLTTESTTTTATAPAGWPVAGADVWVAQDSADPALPRAGPGEEGLVVIGGPGVAAGYSDGGDDGASSTCFVELPSDDGTRRALLTGDRGAIDPATGALHLVGRADRVVKGGGGARVDLDAVEAAVVGGCPGVVAAAAVVLPGVAAPGLAVVAAATTTTPVAVRAWAAAHLPAAAHPGALAVLPALPLLPGGKVDRRAVVAALVAAAAPPAAASTPGEAAVAAAMAVALSRRRETASPSPPITLEATTDFVAVGGDSLDAAAVAASLGGGATTAALILAGRTPRGVARLLAGGGVGGVPAASTGPPTLPLLDPASTTPTGGWRAAWRVPLRACVDAPPTVLGGGGGGCGARVFATSHAGDAACVDAATGAVVWRAELGAAADEGGAAAVGGGSLAAVSLAALAPGGGGGGLAILDTATGALACPLVSLGAGGSPRGPPLAAADGTWWVGTREGVVLKIGDDGQVTSSVDVGVPLTGAPVAGPGGAAAFLVGTGSAGTATLLRLAGGAVAPLGPAGAWPAKPAPASARPVVVVVAGADSLVVAVDTAGCAAAFDAVTGALVWCADLGGPVAAAPAVVSTLPNHSFLLIFPVRSEPALVAVDAATGAVLWQAALPGDVGATGAATTPAVVATRSGAPAVVAVAADCGAVTAFSATGTLLAAARLPAAAYGGPVTVNPALIAVGGRDDAVWGLELCV